jgi:hypothetical protein
VLAVLLFTCPALAPASAVVSQPFDFTSQPFELKLKRLFELPPLVEALPLTPLVKLVPDFLNKPPKSVDLLQELGSIWSLSIGRPTAGPPCAFTPLLSPTAQLLQLSSKCSQLAQQAVPRPRLAPLGHRHLSFIGLDSRPLSSSE